MLNQSFTDFELILVNDGSPDQSGAICEKLALLDKRIIVLHQINQGVSTARNNGLDAAKGLYVVFLDSDDWIESSFLDAYFDELQEDSTQLIYQGFINDFKDKSTELRLPRCKFENGEITKALFEVEKRECLGGACNKIFFRDIIEQNKIRFDPLLSYGEDKIFTLQYCQYISSIMLLDTCYYHYNRTMENSLSKSYYSSEEMIRLIELEYSLFTKLNEESANEQFLHAIRGRYISIHKYALLTMYRPGTSKGRNERILQMKKIKDYMKTYTFDVFFDRDVPKAVHFLIHHQSDLGLMALMWLRRNFSSIYLLQRKARG